MDLDEVKKEALNKTLSHDTLLELIEYAREQKERGDLHWRKREATNKQVVAQKREIQDLLDDIADLNNCMKKGVGQ
jgi:hypothetical protein